MHGVIDSTKRLPQRVLVSGDAGPVRDGFLQRLADLIDVPLVPLDALEGTADAAELAAFDGWLTTTEHDAPRALLLPRAELLVSLDLPAPTFKGKLKRAVRRVRQEPPPADAWIDQAAASFPEVEIVRLTRNEDAEAWLAGLSG